MKTLLFYSSTLLSVLFATPASASELLCLFNGYSGRVYDGSGASFRARTCYSHNDCLGWTDWDWLQPGRSRRYTYPFGGYVQIQWNADGDNDIVSRQATVHYTPSDRSCEAVNSWSFDDARETYKIWLFPGKPR